MDNVPERIIVTPQMLTAVRSAWENGDDTLEALRDVLQCQVTRDEATELLLRVMFELFHDPLTAFDWGVDSVNSGAVNYPCPCQACQVKFAAGR